MEIRDWNGVAYVADGEDAILHWHPGRSEEEAPIRRAKCAAHRLPAVNTDVQMSQIEAVRLGPEIGNRQMQPRQSVELAILCFKALHTMNGSTPVHIVSRNFAVFRSIR